MQESSKQNYLHGAAIMAAGVVVIKILGAIYKIPLGNILGDEGYGYFSVAYNIYNVFLTMATAGMPVALSRMISEADTLGRPMQARKIFRVAWLTFATIGLILGLVMFLFPTELAGMLNNVLADVQARVQPPTDKGRRLKIYYMTQTGVKPPCFVVFCNSKELFHFSYQRYLENQIRAVFGLEGTPIRMVIRQKGEQE